MYLSINVMTIFIIMLSSVVSINIKPDLDRVCNLLVSPHNKFYESLSNLIEFYESEDPLHDCDHSVGFHVTKQYCDLRSGEDTKALPALTAYLTEETKIALIIKFDVKEVTLEANQSESIKHFSFKIHHMIDDFHPSHIFTVVWIREPIDKQDISHTYKISYDSNDDKQNTIQTKDLKQSLRKEEQILVTDIQMIEKFGSKTKVKKLINITFEVNSKEPKEKILYYVNDSYLILCLEKIEKMGSGNCKPIVIEDHGISCECDPKNQLTTIIIMFVFWLIVSITSVRPLVKLLTDRRENERTDFPMLISCNQRNSKFEYIICLRMAKATPDFDLKDVNIDVEFLTASNENVAPALRFRAIILERQLLTQIRIFMWRLTKLPELKKIQCSHSGISDGKIILFCVYTFCRKGNDAQETKIYRINKSIVRESRIFPMIRGDAKDDKIYEDEENQIKSLTNIPLNYTFLEKVWIYFVIISVIAFTAANFPLHWFFGSGSGLVLLKMLTLTLISSSVGIVLSIPFTYVYRLLLVTELKQQAKMNDMTEKICFVLIRVYYITAIIVSIILGLIISFQKTRQKTVDTYKWFCVTFCATALFAFVWVMFSHFTFPTKKLPTEPSDGLEDTSLSAIGIDSQTSHETVS